MTNKKEMYDRIEESIDRWGQVITPCNKRGVIGNLFGEIKQIYKEYENSDVSVEEASNGTD